jgi:hypothetical protein
MQAIVDIISYFFLYYFNCHAKKSTKIQLCQCLNFSPLGHAIIVLLSQTVHWGENIAREKSNHIFPAGHKSFFCDSTLSAYFNWGKHMIFFPPVSLFFPLCLYFFPLGHTINSSTFTGGVLGENIFSLCVNDFPLRLCFPPGHAVWYLLYLPSWI